MNSKPYRIGINGLGRIGRAVFRISEQNPEIEIVAVNDIDPKVENHCYLLKYDSTYGRFPGVVEPEGTSAIKVDGREVRFFSERDVADVAWEELKCDVVIDSSGVGDNVLAARRLIDEKRVAKVVVTHSPKQGLDKTIIFGVNDEEYSPSEHHVISSSICDANACAPVLAALDREFGLVSGFITTLHPWLSYQNLVDGSVHSVTNPGHFWPDMSLGRASPGSLIPKNTTLGGALHQVLPGVADRVQCISFRIPTGIVCAADLTLTLEREVSTEDVLTLFGKCVRRHPRVVTLSDEELVSVDYAGEQHSVNIDSRWIRINRGVEIKLVVWYDNEWAYSCRVVDTALLAVGGLSR